MPGALAPGTIIENENNSICRCGRSRGRQGEKNQLLLIFAFHLAIKGA
jgi:hypothetical protein